MIKIIENGQEMMYWQIVEKYRDNYILIKMVETDYETGKQTGIPLELGDDDEEFYGRYNDGKTVLTGMNLRPLIGGFL
ncbi:MAG: hypothetical protein FWG68_04605 [Defluviitaleaceae bacterium]|nr:hypothetical protein [Defluviitaleaceae bacterium]